MRSGILHLLAGAAIAIALIGIAGHRAEEIRHRRQPTPKSRSARPCRSSGPASAYASIGKTQAAYIKMINEQGGINGRKINLIQYDDAYSPPKAVEQVRKLVESDEVLLTFQIIGTPSNAAVQKYLNAKKVPQLFAATGASKLHRSEELPMDHGLQPELLSPRAASTASTF